MSNSNTKPFKTKDALINLLISRNLTINDRKLAEKTLDRISYYRLSGYTLSLRKNNRFFDGTTFADILKLYEFDAQLRNIILKYTEPVEIQIRNVIAHYHAEKYTPTGYLSARNFYRPDFYCKFIQQVDKEKKRSNELFVSHHINNYNSILPIWACMEILDFSSVSMLYNNLLLEDRKNIAKIYYKDKHTFISNWMHALCICRNIAAHRGRFYNRSISHGVKLGSKYTSLNRHKIFSYIIVLKKLLNESALQNRFESEIVFLFKTLNNSQLNKLGCPEDWKAILKNS